MVIARTILNVGALALLLLHYSTNMADLPRTTGITAIGTNLNSYLLLFSAVEIGSLNLKKHNLAINTLLRFSNTQKFFLNDMLNNISSCFIDHTGAQRIYLSISKIRHKTFQV